DQKYNFMNISNKKLDFTGNLSDSLNSNSPSSSMQYKIDKEDSKLNIICTNCKANRYGIAKCLDCDIAICEFCVESHFYMKCFDHHKIFYYFNQNDDNNIINQNNHLISQRFIAKNSTNIELILSKFMQFEQDDYQLINDKYKEYQNFLTYDENQIISNIESRHYRLNQLINRRKEISLCEAKKNHLYQKNLLYHKINDIYRKRQYLVRLLSILTDESNQNNTKESLRDIIETTRETFIKLQEMTQDWINNTSSQLTCKNLTDSERKNRNKNILFANICESIDSYLSDENIKFNFNTDTIFCIPNNSKNGSVEIYRPGETIVNMKHKFGSEGQNTEKFNSPHGFDTDDKDNIYVADTDNHRIQVFTKEGKFLYSFGIAGKNDGELWYPRKIAIINTSNVIVICDRGRSRTRIQIFKRNGEFIKSIKTRYIDIVAGMTINDSNDIVAVESVNPTIFIISIKLGKMVSFFDCSNEMSEPSDVSYYKDHYYICDFKGHFIAVYNKVGVFIKKIGSKNITNFPNGIVIDHDTNDIIVADSHGNALHLAVISTDLNTVQHYKCPTFKVSRCCGLKIMSDGSIITVAKNNNYVLILEKLASELSKY
ncbi:hypothetical protein A3Q56_07054, partial [Intoshia linei]